MTSKDTNPKDAVGTAKVPSFSVMPRRVVAEVALALLEGARKYGRHNYRAAGVRASVYVDATDRHLSAWWEGQDIDPDSGLSHITKAIASLTVLRDSMLEGNVTDDRPPSVTDAETWVSRLNDFAKKLLERHPNAVEPWTQVRRISEALAAGARATVEKFKDQAHPAGDILDRPGMP